MPARARGGLGDTWSTFDRCSWNPGVSQAPELLEMPARGRKGEQFRHNTA